MLPFQLLLHFFLCSALPLLSPKQQVPEIGSVDVVVEVCGSVEVIQPSLDILRPGGHLILIGLGHPDTQLDILGEQVVRKCLTITGNQSNTNYTHIIQNHCLCLTIFKSSQICITFVTLDTIFFT